MKDEILSCEFQPFFLLFMFIVSMFILVYHCFAGGERTKGELIKPQVGRQLKMGGPETEFREQIERPGGKLLAFTVYLALRMQTV